MIWDMNLYLWLACLIEFMPSCASLKFFSWCSDTFCNLHDSTLNCWIVPSSVQAWMYSTYLLLSIRPFPLRYSLTCRTPHLYQTSFEKSNHTLSSISPYTSAYSHFLSFPSWNSFLPTHPSLHQLQNVLSLLHSLISLIFYWPRFIFSFKVCYEPRLDFEIHDFPRLDLKIILQVNPNRHQGQQIIAKMNYRCHSDS